MIAYLDNNQMFIYPELLKQDNTEGNTGSPVHRSDLEDEFPMDMTTPDETVMADPDGVDSYFPPEEEEELTEEDLDESDHDENIASIYLKEMNKIPLLTRKKEIELARRIQQGERRIRNLILQCPIAVEEIKRLQEKAKRGGSGTGSGEEIVRRTIRKLPKLVQSPGEDAHRLTKLIEDLKETEARVKAAKAEMVQANLRLVVSIVKVYVNRGLSFLDLIQEGNMGLMKAVSKYDYRKGFKFSTYASWWIRQAITRALADKSRTIRIPNHMLETRSKTIKAFHQLIKELGREPLPDEIAKRSGISLNNVLKVMYLIQESVSLETPVGEDGSKLQDLIGNEESQSFNDDIIENMDVAKRIRNLLALLSSREEQILRLRFGIGMPSGYTLEEIGKWFGISRERVRQIEERAIRKLRYPAQPVSSEAGTG